MKEMEIYFQDLTPEAQERLIAFLGGENGNYDVYPLAVIAIEEEEKEV